MEDSFATASQPIGEPIGEKKHHPVVPEPASWGLIVTAFALCVFVYVRYIRPRNRCCGGKCHAKRP